MKTSVVNGFPRMHISLYVSDVEKTVDFYEQFFGMAPKKQKSDYAKFVLDNPFLIISFVLNPKKVSSQFGHLGFQVEQKSEVLAYLECAKQNELDVLEEMDTNCCYANQDKFWVVDPDGYHWEVYSFNEDVEFNDPRYAKESTTACCSPSKPAKTKINLKDLSKQEASCTPGSGCC